MNTLDCLRLIHNVLQNTGLTLFLEFNLPFPCGYSAIMCKRALVVLSWVL